MVQEGVDLKTIQWSQHWSVKSSSVDLNMENFLLCLNVFWEIRLCNTAVFFMITIVAERMAAYESSIKKKTFVCFRCWKCKYHGQKGQYQPTSLLEND